MISIIICSRNKDIPQNLKDNIADTIGVEYELLVVDNSKNTYSIFSAYNEGVRRAKNPYLCFMHEDILYHAQNWGQTIEKHFEDSRIGLIGMAGTHFMPKVPTYWSSSPFISEHNLTNESGKLIESYALDFFKGREIVDVVACDGFCMFIRKELFNVISFDEKNFSGFHYYDMDICMQVLEAKQRVCICKDILIEHSWSDNYSKAGLNSFNTNQKIFFYKWKEHFPINRGIDDVPGYVMDRLNNLYGVANDAIRVRNSKAYKIGKFILSPYNFLLNIRNREK